MSSLTEAEKAWNSGVKHTKKSLFHKPKWREAGDDFARAAGIYQQYNNGSRAAEANMEAGRCYAEGGLTAAAADKYEQAGNMLSMKGKSWQNLKLASEAYYQAGMNYVLAGNQRRCSTMLFECAKCLKVDTPDEAVEKLKDAIHILMTEDRLIYTIDVYEALLEIQLDKANLAPVAGRACTKCGVSEAIETLKTMETAFEGLKQPHNIRRCVLAEICLLCYLGRVSEASDMAMAVPDMRELEAEAGLAISDAAKEQDQELWHKALRHNGMMSMWPCVFRLLSECKFDGSQRASASVAAPQSPSRGLSFSPGATVASADPGDDEEEESDAGERDDSYSL